MCYTKLNFCCPDLTYLFNGSTHLYEVLDGLLFMKITQCITEINTLINTFICFLSVDLGLSSDLHRTTNSYHSGLPTSSTLAPSYSSGFGAHRRMAHSISHGALHGPSVSHSSEFRPIRHAYESSYLTTDYSNINSNISGSSYTAGVPLRRSAASTMPAHTHTIGNGFSSPAYTGDVSR